MSTEGDETLDLGKSPEELAKEMAEDPNLESHELKLPPSVQLAFLRRYQNRAMLSARCGEPILSASEYLAEIVRAWHRDGAPTHPLREQRRKSRR